MADTLLEFPGGIHAQLIYIYNNLIIPVFILIQIVARNLIKSGVTEDYLTSCPTEHCGRSPLFPSPGLKGKVII
jgi:hypothetical protein